MNKEKKSNEDNYIGSLKHFFVILAIAIVVTFLVIAPVWIYDVYSQYKSEHKVYNDTGGKDASFEMKDGLGTLNKTKLPAGIIFNGDYVSFKNKTITYTSERQIGKQNATYYINFNNVDYITFVIDNVSYKYIKEQRNDFN